MISLFDRGTQCPKCGSTWALEATTAGSEYVLITCAICPREVAPEAVTTSAHTYAAVVEQTAIYPGSGSGALQALVYAVLGLTGEAGEVADKLKKVLREDVSLDDARDGLAAELGDVLWYVHRVATELGLDLAEVEGRNAMKLLSRQSRNVLKGSGDNR